MCNFRLLNHPNIVSLLGYVVYGKDFVIIMNFVEGKNLHELFGRQNPYKF